MFLTSIAFWGCKKKDLPVNEKKDLPQQAASLVGTWTFFKFGSNVKPPYPNDYYQYKYFGQSYQKGDDEYSIEITEDSELFFVKNNQDSAHCIIDFDLIYKDSTGGSNFTIYEILLENGNRDRMQLMLNHDDTLLITPYEQVPFLRPSDPYYQLTIFTTIYRYYKKGE